jgi:N utilization substance protein B
VGKRRQGREIVLQSLYAARISGAPLARCLDHRLEEREFAAETVEFARTLVARIDAHREEATRRAQALLVNWDPERVGILERQILIMALVELEHSPDVPWRAVINEACELARRYCGDAAVAFVNGILDRAAAELRGEDGDA